MSNMENSKTGNFPDILAEDRAEDKTEQTEAEHPHSGLWDHSLEVK